MKKSHDVSFPNDWVEVLVLIIREQVALDNERQARVGSLRTLLRPAPAGMSLAAYRKELEAKRDSIERVRALLLTDNGLRAIHGDHAREHSDQHNGQFLQVRADYRRCEEIAADLLGVQKSIDAEIAELPNRRSKEALSIAAGAFVYIWVELRDDLPKIQRLFERSAVTEVDMQASRRFPKVGHGQTSVERCDQGIQPKRPRA